MTVEQVDALVRCAQTYQDACAKARFFTTHPSLAIGDMARVAAIDAKHAYDALVAQIQQVSYAD